MPDKELLGLIALLISFGSHLVYLINIYKDKMRPHKFSWIIWGLSVFIIFFAQLSDGGGAGSWAAGMTGIMIIAIIIVSYWKNPRISITRSDWIFFIAALAAIPLWYVTNSPLWSVMLLTAVDTVGYFPTIRKAYTLPNEESGGLFFLQTIKNMVVVFALENHSLITLTYPVAMVFVNLSIPLIVFFRRSKTV